MQFPLKQRSSTLGAPVWHSTSAVHPAVDVQAPNPSHVSVPAHSLSGSWPNGIFTQVPSEPGRFADSQIQSHDASAHTPSEHTNESHSTGERHDAPLHNCSVSHPLMSIPSQL